MPYACLDCRKSFKRPRVFAPPRYRRCPVCGKPAVGLHPNFKPPRTSNVKQWEKVRYLVEHGFRFRPIWDEETGTPIPYPETLRDAVDWVERWKYLAVTRGGPSVAEPTAAADRPGLTVPEIKKRARRPAGR
jgi:hypothetical protein